MLGRFSMVWREGPVRTPGLRLERGFTHENPGYELTWVNDGAIAFDVGRDRVGAATGACVLLPPGLRNTPWGRGSLYQVMLAPDLVAAAVDQLGHGARAPDRPRELAAGSRISELAAVIARETRHVGADDPGIEALVHGLAIGLVRPDEPDRAPLDPAIRRALDYLAAHHHEVVRVDDLARAAELPRFVFLRRFKAQVGDSPHRHLTRLRLERAAESLRRSDATVLEIALACGFTDPGRFARAFAQRFGATPRAWRAAARSA